jgi:uncharacterized surface protein with fasciclin (FAS1) repeats
VVAGRLTTPVLMTSVKNGGRMAKLKTVEGDELVVKAGRPRQAVGDGRQGDVSMITIADVPQSNGVIHVVGTVLPPM